MTLPFDMEVYTKQLVRSNSHNVGEPGKQFNKLSINQIQAKFGHVTLRNSHYQIIYLFLS